MLQARVYETPIGSLSIIVDPETNSVAAGGFCPPEDLIERMPGAPPWRTVNRMPLTDQPVADYFSGSVSALDGIPVTQPGTDLQHEVWSGLRAIPAGSTRTYRELAATTTKPRAVRAAGSACGKNLVAPIVPCHRALRSDGSLGGYYYGLDVKRWLLDHEAAHRDHD
jgi:methylated-DNA-[protein]-cysteine S-methyltransferase